MNDENGMKLSALMESVLRLGVVESLQSSPKTVLELCENTSVIPEKLERVLLALESLGVFRKDLDTGKWDNTPKCFILDKFKPVYSFQQSSIFNNSFSRTFDSLMVSKTATETCYDMPFFQALHEDPNDLQKFYALMRLYTQKDEDYTAKMDFEGVESIMDVGGGNGELMHHVLKRYPDVKVGIMERPEVIPMVDKYCSENNIQVQALEGNFFESIPEGFDSISMKMVLHDWSDSECITILKNCRAAMKPGKPLYIIEDVVDKNDPGYLMQRRTDMIMMVLLSGKERSTAEFRNILKSSGFELDSVTKAVPKSVIKAIAI